MSEVGSPASSVAGYRPWLDGVRGVAVLLVLVDHVGQVGGLWSSAGLGNIGVGLFFGLSGYLITGLLLDERARTGRVAFGAFYLRRAARLVPALVLMLAVSCAFFVHLGYPQVLEDAFFTLFYLANYVTIYRGDYLLAFGQTWSLAVEEHFYLLWPLVLVMALRRRPLTSLVRWTLVGCAAVLAWRCVLVALRAPDLLLYDGSLERLDALLYGCAAAIAVRAGWRPRRWLTWLAVVVLAAAVVVTDEGTLGKTATQAAAGAASAALVVGLDHHDDVLRRVLTWRPVVWTGVVSYGIYLWHYALLVGANYVDHFHRSLAVSVLMGFVVTPLVAAASFYGLERPVRARVRRRLASRASLTCGTAGAGGAAPRVGRTS